MTKSVDTPAEAEALTTFGARLQFCRKRAGMSQAELGKLFGVTQGAVVGWERQGAQVRLEILMPLSRLFKVSVEWLLEGDGPLPDVQPLAAKSASQSTSLQQEPVTRGLSPLQVAAVDALGRAFRKGAIPTEKCLSLLTEWEHIACA